MPEGNNGKGQIAEAIGRLTGSHPVIQIFFLDIGPEARTEIRQLKEALKELAQANLDKTVTARIVREAFSMGKKDTPEAKLPEVEIPQPDPSILPPGERRLLTSRKWSREDLIEALEICKWNKRETARRFERSLESLRVGIYRNRVTPPGGIWPAGPPTRGMKGWRKQLRSEWPTPKI